jgi:hypothetical protein
MVCAPTSPGLWGEQPWFWRCEVSAGQQAVDVSAEALRQVYANLGIFPSDEEIAAAVPAVQRLYDNDRLLQAQLAPEVEPVPAPRPRPV